MSEVISVNNPDAITQAVEAVRAGRLVVIPTDTSYAVIADAFNITSINELRIAKGQAENVPLPIAAATIETIAGVAYLPTLARDLATAFWPGPLTLMVTAQESLMWNIGPADSALSVRVPRHEVAHSVLAGIGPTVLTGAQKAGQPAVRTIAEAQTALGESVAFYLDAGPLSETASTVVDATGTHLRMVRQGALSLSDIRHVMPMVVDATSSNG